MNRKIRAYRAVIYIVLFYLAAACFLLGPGRALEKDRLVAGQEVIAGVAEVRLDRQIQQVFLAEGTYLKYLELYVSSRESAGEVYRLLVYDENSERLFNREVAMPETQIPGFLRIPLSMETVPGRAYVWQLQGTDTPMELAYENTGETGLACFGNYYVLENGETLMQEAQNIVMRLVYTDRPSLRKRVVLYGGLFLTAAVLTAFLEYLGTKRQRLVKKVRLRLVVRLTLGPLMLAFAAYLAFLIFVQNRFGGQAADKVVYGIGLGLAVFFFGYVIYAPRPRRKTRTLRHLALHCGADWLQSAAFSGALLGCIHFMNAQYQVWQDLAYREVLFWAGLVLLTMCGAKEILRKSSVVWLMVSVLAGGGYYLYRKTVLAGEEAALTLKLLRSEIGIAMVAGLVALALFYKFRRKKFAFAALNRVYTALFIALFCLLLVFRNTRGWPVYMVLVFGLFYLFYLGWENRDRLLLNFCNGVMLNFALACVFAFARRPFRAWVYSRYNFVFHTVTITATYLTLVVCAMTVRLLWKLQKGKRLTDYWGTLLLYGLAMAFLFLTLSRTGYLAVIVMTVLLVPFAIFFVYRKRTALFFKNIAFMAAAAILCLPVAYTGVRLLPALYNDPYIYEVEDSAAAIHKDDPADATSYMSVSYFKYVMENKLFADAAGEASPRLQLYPQDGLYVLSDAALVASVQDMGPGEDFSNGRFVIYRCYMQNWNLTGHDEMGVSLPDGSVSVHAHNSYLQVIHDHGLLTGIVYLLFGAVSVWLMFGYARNKGKQDACAALPLAVFIGFAVAGLVEWLFHPCNPLGFSTMVVLAPLLCFGSRRVSKKLPDAESVPQADGPKQMEVSVGKGTGNEREG